MIWFTSHERLGGTRVPLISSVSRGLEEDVCGMGVVFGKNCGGS